MTQRMTTAEKMAKLVEDLHQEVRRDAVTDILVDLRDTLKGAPEGYRLGLEAAIDLIKSNY